LCESKKCKSPQDTLNCHPRGANGDEGSPYFGDNWLPNGNFTLRECRR
jgi:hypothetical protein